MPNLRQIKQDLEDIEAIEMISGALTEIAGLELKNTQDRIKHNYQFFENISRIYQTLKLIALRRNLLLKKSLSNMNRVKDAVSILITSNTQFYGGLDHELCLSYENQAFKYPGDKIVIGVTGEHYFEARNLEKQVRFIVFQKNIPNQLELKELVEIISQYKKIYLYYSKFITLLDQKIEISDLSTDETSIEALKTSYDYIIEPELPKMLAFFEHQILGSLVKAIFLEAQLSRTASRMVGMDKAEQNAKNQAAKSKQTLSGLNRNLTNLKILETLAQTKFINQDNG